MTTILLTGIPGVGKTDLIRVTQQRSKKTITSISLGDIVKKEAYRLWRTPYDRVPYLDYTHQQALRSYAILEAARQIGCITEGHVVIDTPITMLLDRVVPDAIFTGEQIARLHEARPLDAVVTLVEDPVRILPRIEGKPYPNNPDEIQGWIGSEVLTSTAVSPSHKPNGELVRRLVIPREHSDETLLKLLYDVNCLVGYTGFPITHLKTIEEEIPEKKIKKDSPEVARQKEEYRKRRDDFVQQLNQYVVRIVPMAMIDERANNPVERANTKFRDLYWFAGYADFMIAYFPVDCISAGVSEEMRHVARTGKPVILIHPIDAQSKEVFGFKPTLYYHNETEFYDALSKCHNFEYNHKPEALLRGFLQDGKPRYEHLLNIPQKPD